jgi:ferredoxin, 2Fe-2S
MSRVQYATADGQVTSLEVEDGTSIMQAALTKGLPGINADCGGACQCATCHVYVDEAWTALLPAMGDTEDAMLDCTAEPRQSGSRLSCCLPMSAALDGILVRIPAKQV